jgi:hypothetical protein
MRETRNRENQLYFPLSFVLNFLVKFLLDRLVTSRPVNSCWKKEGADGFYKVYFGYSIILTVGDMKLFN